MRVKSTSGVFKARTLPEVGFVRIDVVLSLLPIGKSTWWAGIKAGKYPPPIKLGPRISAWRVQDIRDVLANLADPEAAR